MSNETDRLARATERIERVTMTTTTGTRSHPRTLSVLDLALEHAEAWAETEPPREGERGGTSNPVADDEAAEIRRVHRLAINACRRLPQLAEEIDRKASELYDLVQRLTATVDPSKLPRPAMPGCASCARTEGVGSQRIGGHFAPVYERMAELGLCRFCYDYGRANLKAWPPVKACDLYHTQSPRAAGIYLAKLAAA